MNGKLNARRKANGSTLSRSLSELHSFLYLVPFNIYQLEFQNINKANLNP